MSLSLAGWHQYKLVYRTLVYRTVLCFYRVYVSENKASNVCYVNLLLWRRNRLHDKGSACRSITLSSLLAGLEKMEMK